MQQALNAKDYSLLSKLAHKAKSSVSIMGMNDLAAELKLLENLSYEGKEPEKYGNIVTRFTNDCLDAIEELHSIKPE
jgi:HPt (histidine-containing phosphotransfer) domain-containing protein